MDRDETVSNDHCKFWILLYSILSLRSSYCMIVASTHAHHAGLNHLFYHAFSFLGVPDHTGGIVLLIAILFLRIGG